MITYNMEVQLEGDTDKCGNYITVQYEFPFPEESVLQAREDEKMRYQLAKFTYRLAKANIS